MAAGNIIARHTGAEAGLVTSGAAGGLILQASAVIAGNDPAKMKRLPDTQGLRNEIIIHHGDVKIKTELSLMLNDIDNWC